ncbi:hypothetical protein [Rhodospirillum centenum]|uniref:hypothetical protein n=1 Tax=Rhodospirillum centenum TaxID=34018 RepID=UPI00059F4CC4|nr:hypothetical protein [Rhodospirillum centenum]
MSASDDAGWEQQIFDQVAVGLIRNSSAPFDEAVFARQMEQNLADDTESGLGFFDQLQKMASGSRKAD